MFVFFFSSPHLALRWSYFRGYWRNLFPSSTSFILFTVNTHTHSDDGLRIPRRALCARCAKEITCARACAYALNFHVMKSLFSKTCQVYIHSPKMLCIYTRTHHTHTHTHKTPTAATHRNKSCCHLINSARARPRLRYALSFLYVSRLLVVFLCVQLPHCCVCCVRSRNLCMKRKRVERLNKFQPIRSLSMYSLPCFLREFRIVWPAQRAIVSD